MYVYIFCIIFQRFVIVPQPLHQCSPAHTSTGEVIRMIRQVNEDWGEGTIEERRGIFPLCYTLSMDPSAKVRGHHYCISTPELLHCTFNHAYSYAYAYVHTHTYTHACMHTHTHTLSLSIIAYSLIN